MRPNDNTIIQRIIELIARKAGVPVQCVNRQDRLLHDLQLYGDDAEEIIIAVGDEFNLDPSKFDFHRYFLSEVSALGILPKFLRKKLLANKKILTVDELIQSVIKGAWPNS